MSSSVGQLETVDDRLCLDSRDSNKRDSDR